MFVIQIKKLTTKEMSSRMYNLQSQQETGAPAKSGNLTSASHSPHRDVPPHASVMVLETNRTMVLYSDVVASRPPSPRKETTVLMTSNAEGYQLNRNAPLERTAVPRNEGTGSISSYENDTPGLDRDDGPWTTVRCRHACSLDLLNNTLRVNKEKLFLQKRLTREQVQTVNMAESHLTAPQKEMIRQRLNKLPVIQRGSLSSQGEGPSNLKGKRADPREWGNANLSEDDLDLGAQAAALESFVQHRAAHKQHQELPQQRKKSSRRHRHQPTMPQLPAGSRPVAQIARDSYLGTALWNVGQTPPNRKDGSLVF